MTAPLALIKKKAGIRVLDKRPEFPELRGFIKKFPVRRWSDVDRFRGFVGHRFLLLFFKAPFLTMSPHAFRLIRTSVIHRAAGVKKYRKEKNQPIPEISGKTPRPYL